MAAQTYILGLSAYYHDSAAALLRDGAIVAAAQEERFSRKRHDARFPRHAIEYCLSESGLSLKDLDYIVFYDKPILKVILKDELASLAGCKSSAVPPLMFTQHHQSHAASAFFASPFERAAVLCMDGVGEWATTSVWLGEGRTLTPQWEVDFPHSLGMLYSAFTYFTGFKVNSGEYKLMGLAPYGEPKYKDVILDRLLDLKKDGTFRLDMRYFNYATGLTMTNGRFSALFGGPPRRSESPISQREMDIASSIQAVTEEIVLNLARTIRREFNSSYLCLAGGVALNCVANGRLLREDLFKDIWIQPAAGDAGGAVGAALAVWHEYLEKPRVINASDGMSGAYLGPRFSNAEIRQYLDSVAAPYVELADSELMPRVAEILAHDNVVGWFQGRMEFGPRALGARSIIGDPRSRSMQSVMNLKIKYRESFRPFAPSILAERVSDYFELDRASPYMLLVAPVTGRIRIPMTEEQDRLFGIEKLNVCRSQIPAITHVDYSARVQTVHKETNPRYYELLRRFEALTGCAVLVNTSFNVRGEPIVCTPEDAYRCFMRTEMDYLVLENCLLTKSAQPKCREDDSWKREFEPD